MLRRHLFALFVAASPVMANEASTAMPSTVMPSTVMPSTVMDVAPTTLELKPGIAGLFYVTNHGARPVTVQIEAADWTQDQGRDVLAPSSDFFASPPFAKIAPGARQTVRVMARPAGGGEQAYRLLVSELPDDAGGDGVHVLLQFSVPVFVHAAPPTAPVLSWSAHGGILSATNSGSQTVKLDSLSLDGQARETGLVYLLPGATHAFGAVPPAPAHVSARDARSGLDLSADVAP